MNFIEINNTNINNYCEKLYNKIDFEYNIVIFVAKGGYYLGEYFAKKNNTPLLEVMAERNGGKIKKILRPLLKILPFKLKQLIREVEYKSGYHNKKIDRKVNYNKEVYSLYKNYDKILIVDDSVDTGNTIKLVKDKITCIFKNAKIKTLSLNVMKKSNYYPNYFLVEDALIKGPWSSDSKENKKFLNDYFNWKKKNGGNN